MKHRICTLTRRGEGFCLATVLALVWVGSLFLTPWPPTASSPAWLVAGLMFSTRMRR